MKTVKEWLYEVYEEIETYGDEDLDYHLELVWDRKVESFEVAKVTLDIALHRAANYMRMMAEKFESFKVKD